MAKPIVFIQGAFVTPLCWEQFNGYFTAKGYACSAPPWPYRDQPIAELRSNPDPRLARLGIAEIVDHYASIIKAMSEPPILIGHSFGGMFVQILLDRGLGGAGVAIDPAPPRGVLAFTPSAIRANSPVLLTWMGWQRIVRMSLKTFRYAFVNTLPPAEQRAVYQRQVVPETGRIFFQTAFAPLRPSSPARVNFKNSQRAPLLITAGGSDHIVPASVNRSNYRKYKDSAARTDFKEFTGRSHWIMAELGWEEVAGYIDEWLGSL
jgi:pimeloyl-ACP methyl ester carboxylesterase